MFMLLPRIQDVFLGQPPKVVSTVATCGPNPGCMVCGRTLLHLHADTGAMTLGQLIDKV